MRKSLETTFVLAVFLGGCDLQNGGLPSADATVQDVSIQEGAADVVDDASDGGMDADSDLPDVVVPIAPDQVGSLRVWLRDRIVVSDAGSDAGLVEGWNDQRNDGGPNLTWMGARPALEPASAAYNGHDAVRFTYSSGDRLTNTTINIVQPFSVMVVGQAGQDSSYFFDSATATRAAILTTLGRKLMLFTSAGSYSPVTGFGNVLSPSIVIAVFSGSSSALYVSSTSGMKGLNPGGAGLGGLTVGSWQNGAYGLAGLIAEVAIWDKVVDDPTIAKLLLYGSQRYNIALQ